jgi:hypothetical protein
VLQVVKAPVQAAGVLVELFALGGVEGEAHLAVVGAFEGLEAGADLGHADGDHLAHFGLLAAGPVGQGSLDLGAASLGEVAKPVAKLALVSFECERQLLAEGAGDGRMWQVVGQQAKVRRIGGQDTVLVEGEVEAFEALVELPTVFGGGQQSGVGRRGSAPWRSGREPPGR